MAVAKGKAAPRKRRPATPRPVTVTVTTTYRLTQAEYDAALVETVEGMEQYSYGRNAIPKTVKITTEGVK